jgi:Zn-dependent peptidase ImmA (M78 family)
MTLQTSARTAAERTLEATWRGEGYPVDPVAIAHRLGLRVWDAELRQGVTGLLRKAVSDAAEIYLPLDYPEVRRRFMCAHELGHYVRHTSAADGWIGFIDRRGAGTANGDDPDEVFANEFADALLMPEREVRALFRRGIRDLEMSQRFQVSVEATKRRLERLGLDRGR